MDQVAPLLPVRRTQGDAVRVLSAGPDGPMTTDQPGICVS